MDIGNIVRLDLNEKSSSYVFNPSDTAKRIFAYRDTCGHYITTSEYYEDRERYAVPLILYLNSGSFFYCSDERIIRVKPGELAVFDTSSPHIYGTDVSSEFVWLHIGGNGIRELVQEITLFGENNVFSGDVINPMRDFLYYMLTLCSENLQISESEVSLMIYKNLYSLIPYVQNETFAVRRGSEYIIESVEFIRNNYHRKISVKDIASNVHLSEAHFSRVFKNSMGISPYSYLREYRINMAKILLEQGMSISETAQKTGWSSDSNFIYAFKQSVGVSPGCYMK